MDSRGIRSHLPALLAALCCIVGFAAEVTAAGRAEDQARSHVREHRRDLGLRAADLREMTVSSAVESRHNGITHVYFQQRHRGIDVHNGILNVNLTADGTVLSAGSRFVAGLARSAAGQQAARTAPEAAAAAARHLGLTPSRPFEVLSTLGLADGAATLSDGGIAERPIEARLVWVAAGSGVRLAWELRIDEIGGQHWWLAHVDAATGADLGTQDLVIHDSVTAIAAAIAHPRAHVEEETVATFPPTDGATYEVFPIPFESPSDGARALVSNAADPGASPFGWHDTDGAPGAELTVTRGNNVHAYTDIDANNVPDPGSDPDGGAGLTFSFPLDLTQDPSTYRPAAVTNLFYWNNVMHDVTHGYGFDEAAGNFQVTNYGGLGLGGDDVRAEAQDGSGLNNANFGTPVDGARPRMQMFVWTHPVPNVVTVISPASIAGDYDASGAAFGPSPAGAGPLSRNLTLGGLGVGPSRASGAAFGPSPAAAGPISGNLTLVDDGVGPSTTDGCEPLVGFPAGDIALLDRGSCAFVLKVNNAQAAGAAAVVVANNVGGGPITMGGADPTILIPSVMVSMSDGDLFKANLPVAATVQANPAAAVNRDSDLDAGVIAHEYGHGVSNRLTGGPGVVGCLSNAEQMGEGWSDWFALTLTTHPSDNQLTARGVGSYLRFQPANGPGIRPTPYSTDMGVNPSTYASVADVANISQPHGIGYVWNTMLWEVYWNLVDRYGHNADVYGDWTTGGNNLGLQLVMDGLKLQPCLPGFVDGRNAILAADAALTAGTNQCEIWRGFAKRGLGASASQGLSTNRLDGVEAFDLPASCLAATFGGFRPPVDDAPAINNVNAGSTVPVKFTLSGAGGDLSIDSQPVDCVTLLPTGEAPQPPNTNKLKQEDDEYHFNWKTDGAWAGTCRRLTLRIPAASDAVAYFAFF